MFESFCRQFVAVVVDVTPRDVRMSERRSKRNYDVIASLYLRHHFEWRK